MPDIPKLRILDENPTIALTIKAMADRPIYPIDIYYEPQEVFKPPFPIPPLVGQISGWVAKPSSPVEYEAAVSQYDVALSSIEQAKQVTLSQIKALDAQKVQLTEARAAMVKEYEGMKKTQK